MKYTKIVLVAEWDGWCGSCADERPLVLTRTGRQRLRTWLTGAADDSRPLVLTCRLCGTGVDVPLAEDDPPVELSEEAELVTTQSPTTVLQPPAEAPTPAPVTVTVAASDAELAGGRQAVAQALAALVARRSTVPTVPTVAAPRVSPVLAAEPMLGPALPVQRTPSNGGLAELQLLADGIDLLSSGRA